GLDPEALEEPREVLGRDVPRRAGRERASAEAAGRAVERRDAGLVGRERVGRAHAVRVVEVPRAALEDPGSPEGRRDPAHLLRGRLPDRVADRDLEAPEIEELPGDRDGGGGL